MANMPFNANMDLNAPPYLTRAKGVNLFNDLYCWLYFHVFAASQKMGWLMPTSEWTLDQIFARRLLDNKGSATDKQPHASCALGLLHLHCNLCNSAPRHQQTRILRTPILLL